MMLEERGTKFDPRLLDLFMANLSSVREILSSPELSDEVSADSGLLEQKAPSDILMIWGAIFSVEKDENDLQA